MRINEIFYSLQGEGFWTGTPAVFVRFSGCNLKCSFCDTEHFGYRDMSVEQIVEEVSKFPAKRVILTGGEPLLQVNERLLKLLKSNGIVVHVETNGTIAVSDTMRNLIDWITVSPKSEYIQIADFDELKVVYQGQNLKCWDSYLIGNLCSRCYLQPCDYGDAAKNLISIARTVEFIKSHPTWTLSLQTHKLIDIP